MKLYYTYDIHKSSPHVLQEHMLRIRMFHFIEELFLRSFIICKYNNILIEFFPTSETINQIKSPFGLIVGNHMSSISDQNLGKISNLFDITGQIFSDMPLSPGGCSIIFVSRPFDGRQETFGQWPGNYDIQLSIVDYYSFNKKDLQIFLCL